MLLTGSVFFNLQSSPFPPSEAEGVQQVGAPRQPLQLSQDPLSARDPDFPDKNLLKSEHIGQQGGPAPRSSSPGSPPRKPLTSRSWIIVLSNCSANCPIPLSFSFPSPFLSYLNFSSSWFCLSSSLPSKINPATLRIFGNVSPWHVLLKVFIYIGSRLSYKHAGG